MNSAVEVTDTPAPQPRHTWIRHVAATICLVAMFVATYKLFTLNDDGPLWYHPDEASKVWQLIGAPTPENPLAGLRNYRHPQLLLEVTEKWLQYFKTPRDAQAVVEAGRHVSGLFAATAATTLAATGYLAFGFPGLVITAAAMGLCPSLLVYAHHMKEDAALACGVGAVVFASALYWRVADSVVGWLIVLPLLGFAAALAPSGKYVGIFSLACALPTLAMAPGQRWWTFAARLITFTLAFAFSVSLINHRVFDNYTTFLASFEMEKEHGMTGHFDLTMDAPNVFILHVMRVECGWPVVVLASLGIVLIFTRPIFRGRDSWYRRDGWLLVVAVFVIVVIATLSMSRIPFHRYALPAVVLMQFVASLAAGALGSFVVTRIKRRQTIAWMTATCALAGSFVAYDAHACATLTRGFGDDGRQHMRQWVNDNIPPGTLVACNRYTELSTDYPTDRRSAFGQGPLKIRCIDTDGSYFSSPESIERLKKMGVKYIAVCDAGYERYTLPFTHGMPHEEREFNGHRAFYETLFGNYPLVWHWDPQPPTGTFVNPEVRIYKID